MTVGISGSGQPKMKAQGKTETTDPQLLTAFLAFRPEPELMSSIHMK